MAYEGGKKQWMISAPGKKDFKQTTVDTKSKCYYIPMLYGDLPLSLTDWPGQFTVSTSFASIHFVQMKHIYDIKVPHYDRGFS